MKKNKFYRPPETVDSVFEQLEKERKREAFAKGAVIGAFFGIVIFLLIFAFKNGIV